MEITEILKKEENNVATILLFKEGLFWRAYDNSAILFCENIKRYNLQKKHIKKVNREIVFLGYPNAVHTTIIELAKAKNYEIKVEEKLTVIKADFIIPNFEQLKNEIQVLSLQSNEGDTIKRLKDFPVLHSSPLQCQHFIIELQKQINGTI